MRSALAGAGWSVDALDDLLGVTARTHLYRDELAPLLRRTGGGSPLETLARLFVIGTPVPAHAAAAAGVPVSWLAPDGSALVRVQPVRHGGIEVLCPHDPGRAATGVDPRAVLGVGAASLTLAAATPRDVVGRALDLGTGSGVQALLAADHTRTVVATDSNPRAVAYATLAGALNDADLDVRTGDLLEPVAAERFDLVVSNPPFVVGPQRRDTYRDAGLPGDEVCRRLVRQIPAYLAPGGLAVLLVNWLHVAGQNGDERVRSWFDGTGCDAWVVQRELAAPEDYVTAWLRDTDEGGRFDELYDPWLDALQAQGVEAVAFGVLAMRLSGREGAGRVTLEEVDQGIAPTWGGQARWTTTAPCCWQAATGPARSASSSRCSLPAPGSPTRRRPGRCSRSFAGWSRRASSSSDHHAAPWHIGPSEGVRATRPLDDHSGEGRRDRAGHAPAGSLVSYCRSATA